MPSHKIHLLTDSFYNDWFYKNYVLKEINVLKGYKHNLFESYDKYIMKHFKLNKFNSIDVIKKIPQYEDIVFNYEDLEKYINDYNNEIEQNCIDLEYSIEQQDILEELYSECIKYIESWLKDNNICKKEEEDYELRRCLNK